MESICDTINGETGAWQFKYNARPMLVLTDETHNRMRVIAPIQMADSMSDDEIHKALKANFHSALDVRYAVGDDILWSAYIHPLKELTEDQFRDAMLQVYRAAETFGTSYSSTELVFPGGEVPSRRDKPVKKKM